MKRPVRLLALAALAGLAVPVGAHAAPAPPAPPTLRAESVYVHCNGATKLANATVAADATRPTWDTRKPTASLTTGAGCGWVDPGAIRHTTYEGAAGDAAFAGTFTGNLSSLTVKMHNIFVGPGRQTNRDLTLRVSLRIDGKEMFTPDSDVPGRGTTAVTPTMSSSGLSGEFAVTVTDLPFAKEAGDGDDVHDVEVLVGTSEPVNGWVYDTSEVPTGIDFNPATPAAARLAAAR